MKKIMVTIVTFVMIGISGTAFATGVPDNIFVQFGNAKPAPETGGAAYSPTGNYHWNTFGENTGTNESLYNTSDALTAATMSWTTAQNNDGQTAFGTKGDANNSYGYELMKGQLSTTNKSSVTISIANLTNGTYTLYVYSQDQPNTVQSTTFKINNGSPVTLATSGKLTTFTSGIAGNYFEQQVQVTNGKLDISFASTTGGRNNKGIINGFQLIDLPASASASAPAPEPSTYVLMGIGGLLTAVRLRKSRLLSDVSA